MQSAVLRLSLKRNLSYWARLCIYSVSWNLFLNWVNYFDWTRRREKKGWKGGSGIWYGLILLHSNIHSNTIESFSEKTTKDLLPFILLVTITYSNYITTGEEGAKSRQTAVTFPPRPNLCLRTAKLNPDAWCRKWVKLLMAQGRLIYTGHRLPLFVCPRCVIPDSFVLSSYCYDS